ncbi:MAG TPA: Ada metal-binding domain-containing protein [Chryseosolibacter sp.]
MLSIRKGRIVIHQHDKETNGAKITTVTLPVIDPDPVDFKRLVHSGMIRCAGNRKLKIYGKLSCASGRRMKKVNRVFFGSDEEALFLGYRPCGHCMRTEYEVWRGRK